MVINDNGKTTLRYDTEANWARVNPLLEKGETIIVIFNNKQRLKCGDGINRYNDLPFILGDDGEVKTVTWAEIVGKPTEFTPSEHNHDSRYYTETEINTKLNDKANKSTTLAGYGITNAYTKTETDTNFIKNNQTFSNWNNFGNLGNKKLYIDTLDNIFWGLGKRYFVTATLHDRNVNGVEYPYIKNGANIADDEYFIDSPASTTYAQSVVNSLFNGSFESGIQVPYGKYLKIHIQFSNEENWKPSTTKSSFPGYPYGDYYFTHYYNGGGEKIQVRTYQTHTNWAIGWHLDEASVFYKSGTTPLNSSSEIWKLTASGYYTRKCIEIIVYGRDNTNATSPVSTTSKTQLTEILYFGTRATMDKTPVFVKGQTQKLYDVLQIGDQTNNNITLNPNGSVTAKTFNENGQTLEAKYSNKIETVKVNGTALAINTKSVNVDLTGKQDVMTEVTNEEILNIINS